MKAPAESQVLKMLKESNAIEGVYGDFPLAKAKEAWNFLNSFGLLGKQVILSTHEILMSGSDLEREHWGVYRPIQVYVGSHTPPPPGEINRLMRNWVRRANNIGDPIADHIAFEEIHPFVDGNGRMGRILMNWQLVRRGEPLQIYTAARRGEYYNLFKVAHLADKAVA